VKSPSHVLCRVCRSATKIHTEDPVDTLCADCGSSMVDLVNIVACPIESPSPQRGGRMCSLPFHDYERDCHVVPWEQRDMLSLAGE
jgi:hypothetical protein